MRKILSNLGMAVLCAGCCFSASNAQTGGRAGTITGRIIYEDGGGAPNLSVYLISVKANQQPASQRGPGERTVTDQEGNFKFTDLAAGIYMINIFESKGYVRQPISAAETQEQKYCRVGDNVSIMMVRGGVITGRIITANGEPMAGVRAYPIMVRDADGLPIKRQAGGRPRMTDDRGVYRLYGLAPGTYVLYTRPENFGSSVSPYEGNVPTYHPSSTRDTAVEIAVTSGSETTGIDIRFRGERGRVVSGTVAGVIESSSPYSNAMVLLTSLSTGNVMYSSVVRPGENVKSFAIHGLPDGEYELTARHSEYNLVESYSSLPRRITVRGADVTGIELRLAPMASIAGKLVLETASAACENERKSTVEDVALQARRDAGAGGAVDLYALMQRDSVPDDKGVFSISNLEPGRYFLESKLPNENWFVKSITANVPAPAPGRGAARSPGLTDIARGGVALKAGEKLTGLVMTVAAGAASLRGKVVAENEGARLPSRMRVHLAPAEAAAGDDVLRYAETAVRGDSSFVFNHIAPGKYRLITRAVPEDEPSDRPPMPAAWDANERAKLRREAVAWKNEIELKPCQRVTDHVLRWQMK